tara:strand:+ start:595 stop:762 length:168 start_codon:yes stop_codon:yes gene_type:complete
MSKETKMNEIKALSFPNTINAKSKIIPQKTIKRGIKRINLYVIKISKIKLKNIML